MDTLAIRCRGNFDNTTISRGNSYVNQERVNLVDVWGATAEARVMGSRASAYDVHVNWGEAANGVIEVECSCPRFRDGVLCKHIWATFLEMDRSGLSAKVTGRGPLQVDDLADDFDAWDGETLPMMKPQAGSRSAPAWRTLLEPLDIDPAPSPRRALQQQKTRQLWYLLNVTSSVHRGDLIVDLYHQDLKKNGDWGAFKRFAATTDNLATLTNEEDRLLAEALIGNPVPIERGYYYHYEQRNYESACIPPALYEFLLPRLIATGRLAWMLDTSMSPADARPVQWDDSVAQFHVHVTEDDKQQEWSLEGHLRLGDEEQPLGELVFALSSGLMMRQDQISKWDATVDVRWIEVLLSHGPIRVPYKDRDALLKTLWSMPQLPPTTLPDSLLVEEIRTAPRARLSIPHRTASRVDRSQLFADLSFGYDDNVVRHGDRAAAVYKDQENRVHVRDLAAEQQFAERLGQIGVSVAPFHSGHGFTLRERDLGRVVRELTGDGWLVEAEGLQIRQPGVFNMSVTSDVDWFELHGEVDFGGVSASLPALLAAMRNGDEYIQLDDGTQGLLPDDWLKKYGRLASLAETDSDSLRFASTQALLLDALLAEQDDVTVDRGFRAYRKKLKSFDGVKPKQEPRGFGGELRDYQRDGLGWLHFLRDFRFGGCLADDMGLGKTVQVLALLDARRTRRVGEGESRAPSLVVVPKSLVFNWIDEAAKFTPKLKVLNYTGKERHEYFEQLSEYDVIVTTYGSVRRDILKLKDLRFDYAILDESQAIKNRESQAAKACRLLSADHRLAMTGTPIENHLGELWSLFEFLNPGMLGQSTAFTGVSKTTPDDRDMIEVLAQSLRPFILRRTKEEVLTELPKKTEQTLHCELPPRERKQYDELRDYYRINLTKTVKEKGINRSKIHVLEALLRLRQAACHPALLDKKKTNQMSAKLETLLEQLDEVLSEGHKALVFSQFTSLLAIVRHHLDKRGAVYEYLDGRTRKRGDKVKRFQEDPNCPLFLISLKAGGHGLNLTAADYVFILDPWWNPAVEAQAIDRAHRIGQERPVFAYRLIARDTVEEKIVELQKSKRDLADAIISADNSLIRSLTAEDLELLLS